MNILPLRAIDDSEKEEVGRAVYNLSVLKRQGYPVPEAWCLLAPVTDFLRIARSLEITNRHILETSWKNFSTEVFKLEVPDSISVEQWQQALKLWLGQFQQQVYGIDSLPKQLVLTCQLIWSDLPTDGMAVSGVFDLNEQDVRVTSKQKINPVVSQEIDKMVRRADKTLFLAHQYDFWVQGKQLWLIGLHPSTEIIVPKPVLKILPKESEQLVKSKAAARPAMKIVLDVRNDQVVHAQVDGILTQLDTHRQIGEIAKVVPDKQVFCLLTNTTNVDLEGSLGIVHHQTALRQAAEQFLDARNKQNCANVQLVLPLTKSAVVSQQLKKELGALGIHRKGSLQFWQLLSLPENIVNIQHYIGIELDGFFIDVDRLYLQLTGIEGLERPYYTRDWKLLTNFLGLALKAAHQAKLPVILLGELALQSEMVEFAVESGIVGLVVPKIEAEGLTEHLAWAEKKVIDRRIQLQTN